MKQRTHTNEKLNIIITKNIKTTAFKTRKDFNRQHIPDKYPQFPPLRQGRGDTWLPACAQGLSNWQIP